MVGKWSFWWIENCSYCRSNSMRSLTVQQRLERRICRGREKESLESLLGATTELGDSKSNGPLAVVISHSRSLNKCRSTFII